MRVIIAADSALLRAGLARLLRDAGMDVVATAGDCAELARKARAHQPDVAVVSLDDTPCRSDRLPVLMLAQSVDHERAVALLDNSPAGVGYLLEHRVPDVERFVAAVREVAAGGSVLDPAVVAEVLGRRTTRDVLSAREREVLELMAEGRSNQGIADRLAISERGVQKHVTSIFEKLGIPAGADDHRRVLAVLTFLRS
jgi:DNA-binding NarL/FixJ family response regulator